MKIKKGDTVYVLSGNDKGKKGEVLEGGIISVECAIHSSKLAVVCPKCGKPTRVGYEMEKDEKVRVCKKCGAKLK